MVKQPKFRFIQVPHDHLAVDRVQLWQLHQHLIQKRLDVDPLTIGPVAEPRVSDMRRLTQRCTIRLMR